MGQVRALVRDMNGTSHKGYASAMITDPWGYRSS